MNENVKSILGYEKLYTISDKGIVVALLKPANPPRRYSDIPERIMNTPINKAGYMYCSLNKGSHSKIFLIHRLIAQYFIPNPDNKPCVNHIDGNKTNNEIENLEWVTHKENTQHAIQLGLIKRVKRNRCINYQVAEQIRIERKNMRVSELAKKYKVAEITIYNIINNKTWKKGKQQVNLLKKTVTR